MNDQTPTRLKCATCDCVLASMYDEQGHDLHHVKVVKVNGSFELFCSLNHAIEATRRKE